MWVFETLTKALPKSWQPAAKAIYPAVATFVAVIVQWIQTGVYDGAELYTSAIGIGTALLVYLTPNKKKVA